MTWDWQTIVTTAVPPAVFAAIGYFVRGWLPSERRKDHISTLSAAATVAAVMREQGLSLEDIKAVAAQFSDQKRRQDADPSDDRMGNYWTQASMNERAHLSAAEAQARLDSASLAMRQIISEDETSSFEACESAWVEFRDRQAEFVAAEVEGGSMQPLVRSSEIADLNQRRARELNAMFQQRSLRET